MDCSSRITSLFVCVPRNSSFFTGFEQSRNVSAHLEWDYWKELIEHTLNKGCGFIYLLNSPKALDPDNPELPKSLEKLDIVLMGLLFFILFL